MFSGLLVGAMLPFWFSAMTMKSVGKAALAMVEEVRRQFNTISGLMEGTARPDYSRCVEISTSSSLREMIAPGKLGSSTHSHCIMSYGSSQYRFVSTHTNRLVGVMWVLHGPKSVQ